MDKKFHFYDFTITLREIIASVSIIAIMLLIGVLISERISEHQIKENDIYNKAVKIENNTELFQYGIDTNVGNAFVYGDLQAVDTVSHPEIDGEYIYLKKVEEHYNMHTRTYTTTSNGKTTTHTQIYYSWDYYDEEDKSAKEVSFCNIIFPINKIELPTEEYINTIKESSHVRYKYYGIKTKYTGTLFTDLRNKTISDNSDFYNNMTIDEVVNMLESNVIIIVFWIVWIIVIIICVLIFYYLDNKWLE